MTATIERQVDSQEVIWSPQEGSQSAFMDCPMFEALYHGTRGPGKTDALLMSFAQHTGKGHGENWRGIVFRQTYPQLADAVAKAEKWFRRIFPEARFNRAQHTWTWPTGEALLFRHMQRPEDYWKYHGHEYPFIGFEELTNWPTDECFTSMFACCRSSHPDVPRMVRATTNPYGVGHNWVKTRYGLHGKWWQTVVLANPKDADGTPVQARCAIHGHVRENQILLRADPNYLNTVVGAASNKAMKEAWLNGSWDIVAGGMFDDVWDSRINDVPPFDVPTSWRITRGFDWGSSKPFSVGWYAISDGTDLVLKDGRVFATVRNDTFRVKEWYGFTGQPNQGLRMLAVDIARGIVERELSWGWRKGKACRVKPGPADSSIYVVENGTSIAIDMERPTRIGETVFPGVSWTHADKRPGSRKSGWEIMRKMIAQAKRQEGLPREKPGFFVIGDENPEFLRTVLTLPRCERDMDDVDTDAEDHIADEVRYQIRAIGAEIASGVTTGVW